MPLLTQDAVLRGAGRSADDPHAADGAATFGNELRAYDKATGAGGAGDCKLPAGATGAMMTYMHEGKQFIVVPIGATNHPAEFVALSLP